MKNEYVQLEPRSKETFEISDMLIMDSSVQVIYNNKTLGRLFK